MNEHFQQYQEVQRQIKALQEQANQLMLEGRSKAISDTRQLIAAYEIKPEELGFPARPAAKPRPKRDRSKDSRDPKGQPKYRDPASGATWTGNGKPPAWIDRTGNRDDFLIHKPAPIQPPQEQFAPQAQHAAAAANWPQIGGAGSQSE